GQTEVTKETTQSLQSMSSGEQKKALLKHLLTTDPDYLILDNPFDNLDKDSQAQLKQLLTNVAKDIVLIQIISRKDDLLPFITHYSDLLHRELSSRSEFKTIVAEESPVNFKGFIPPPLQHIEFEYDTLIELKKVNVSYNGRPILKDINWRIGKGEFWELSGNNGSGKTTILSMITGENPKGYGQNLFLFGHMKGSGESVWDIKKNIGYFTPSMTDKFTGYHSVEHMMISGILDSVGLYVQPTEAQLRLAKEWMLLIDMWKLKDKHFHDLTMGQKRLVMTTRAMIKHPLLLILDEPTAGLDDDSATLLVSLVNKIAKESNSTLIFVSHRTEQGLNPDFVFRLEMNDEGSRGTVQ
ncbi:MAG: ATP-binding cassette domain-containing protein, partial [Maribacter sp.]|nr:ATP-binding cassette domain-containing protein [Maribacter sp.]